LLQALNPFAIFTGRKCILDLVWSRCKHCNGKGCAKHGHTTNHAGHHHDGHHHNNQGSIHQHPQRPGQPTQVMPQIDPTVPRVPPAVQRHPVNQPPIHTRPRIHPQPRNVIPNGQVIPQQGSRHPNNARPTIPPIQVQPVEPRTLPHELKPQARDTTPPPPAVEYNPRPQKDDEASKTAPNSEGPAQQQLRSRPPVLVQPDPVQVLREPIPKKGDKDNKGPRTDNENELPRNEVPPNVIPQTIRPKAADKSPQSTAPKSAKPETKKDSTEQQETEQQEEQQQERTSLRKFIFTR